MIGLIHKSDAEDLQDQEHLDNGRLLQFAMTRSADEGQCAVRILSDNNAVDAKVYDVPIRARD